METASAMVVIYELQAAICLQRKHDFYLFIDYFILTPSPASRYNNKNNMACVALIR